MCMPETRLRSLITFVFVIVFVTPSARAAIFDGNRRGFVVSVEVGPLLLTKLSGGKEFQYQTSESHKGGIEAILIGYGFGKKDRISVRVSKAKDLELPVIRADIAALYFGRPISRSLVWTHHFGLQRHAPYAQLGLGHVAGSNDLTTAEYFWQSTRGTELLFAAGSEILPHFNFGLTTTVLKGKHGNFPKSTAVLRNYTIIQVSFTLGLVAY